jgi:HD-like signal output (HDOD) protein
MDDQEEWMSALPIADENDALRELIAKVDELAVLPHVVFKVLEITGDCDSPAHEMERAITVDPGFSSRVLVLANSAYFGLPKRVTSIKEAIMFLGYKAVRNLAMSVGVFDLFVGKNDAESLRRRAWWRHSVDTAVCCRWLAGKAGKTLPDDSYTCGLLHYIGKTLLDRFGKGDYNAVSEMEKLGVPDYQAEREIFGCDHVEVALAATIKWGFPEVLVAGLQYVTKPEEGQSFPAQRASTALGSAIATIATHGRMSDDVDLLINVPEWALAELGLDPGTIEAIIEGGTSAIAAAQLHF